MMRPAARGPFHQQTISRSTEEGPITARLEERPSLTLARLREVRPRDLALRFLAGAATSIVAGVISYAVSARVGGFFLAFPAILGASLTLVEEQEDSAEAREDSRGATIGGCALAAFAAVAALSLSDVPSVLALALATAAWAIGALGGYLVAWFR